MSLQQMLRGISGEFEINRVVGAFGSISYIVTACGLTWWQYLSSGAFDLQVFCLAFPTGLGVAVGSIAGACALKDRNVAKAQAQGANNGTA